MTLGLPAFLVSTGRRIFLGRAGRITWLPQGGRSTLRRFSLGRRGRRSVQIPAIEPWTDDYSNMLGLVKWR